MPWWSTLVRKDIETEMSFTSPFIFSFIYQFLTAYSFLKHLTLLTLKIFPRNDAISSRIPTTQIFAGVWVRDSCVESSPDQNQNLSFILVTKKPTANVFSESLLACVLGLPTPVLTFPHSFRQLFSTVVSTLQPRKLSGNNAASAIT